MIMDCDPSFHSSRSNSPPVRKRSKATTRCDSCQLSDLLALQLRESNEVLLFPSPHHQPQTFLHCAHRTIMIDLIDLSKLACFLSPGRAPMLVNMRPSNEALLRARVPGAQDQRWCLSSHFHRARSASKKGTWPYPPHHFEATRCASTGDPQAPSPPLFLLIQPPHCTHSSRMSQKWKLWPVPLQAKRLRL